MKIVSIIIPTYNSEKTIKRAIDSVLNQEGLGTLFDVEIIISDDASTDNTLEICNEYQVVVISNNDNSGGPNRGRNQGIKAASGDYIAFLDHDDEWLPNKLIKQLKEIDNGAEFVSSQYIKIQ